MLICQVQFGKDRIYQDVGYGVTIVCIVHHEKNKNNVNGRMHPDLMSCHMTDFCVRFYQVDACIRK